MTGYVNASSYNQPQTTEKTVLSGTYGPFRNNDPLKAIIFMGLIVAVMLTLFSLLARQVIPATILAEPDHHISITLRVIYMAGITIHILCVPFYCLWINRSCKNAWLLNPPKMKATPAWAVAYYFIPIVSLWKPYSSMLEIRNASFGMRANLTRLLPLWWFSWLAFMILTAGQLTGHLSINVEIMAILDKLGSVADIASIALNYLSIAVVVSITNAQNKRASELRT